MLFDPAILISKRCFLFVFVVIICNKSRPWTFNWWMYFILSNLKGIIVSISVRSSEETSFLSYEFIVIRSFKFFLGSAKRLHSSVKCIHSPRHCRYELWLRVVNKNIEFISFLFVFVSLFNNFIIRKLRSWCSTLLLRRHDSFFVFVSQVYSFCILEILNSLTFVNSLG